MNVTSDQPKVFAEQVAKKEKNHQRHYAAMA